ncbi:hypothetical protein [Lignipirellula cremea]|uniref:SPOR domain-containing protein n=1 Tax=Lignipirellula cremea TaxID=2528010 RepID=A0A518E3N4_9BACT|nr:hypothetical protein [Lignipirellula cremea]QDU98701.1 hypothetical protein Pla8534_65740 [Lignipirellula cremea]
MNRLLNSSIALTAGLMICLFAQNASAQMPTIERVYAVQIQATSTETDAWRTIGVYKSRTQAEADVATSRIGGRFGKVRIVPQLRAEADADAAPATGKAQNGSAAPVNAGSSLSVRSFRL